jgi:hypothetical protein
MQNDIIPKVICRCAYNRESWVYIYGTIDCIVVDENGAYYHPLLCTVYNEWHVNISGRLVKINCPKCISKSNRLKNEKYLNT